MIDSVLNALRTPPEAASAWSTAGFAFTQLSYHIGPVTPPSPSLADGQSTAGSIAIDEPADGTVVAPGAQVAVSVSGSPEVTSLLVLVFGSGDIGLAAELAGPGAAWSFMVPQNAVGSLVIQAVGSGAGGSILVSPSVTLSVGMEAVLDSIEARPTARYVTVGSQFGQAVYGHYHDGVMRSLVGVEGITIQSSNSAIVNAVAPDSIVALGPGTATLMMTFQGKSATVQATVSAVTITGVPIPTPTTNSSQPRILFVAPNPSWGRVNFRFELGLRSLATELDVFDVNGRRVRRLQTSPSFGPGAQTVSWDRTNDLGTAVRAGVYYVRLQVGTTTANARFVLLR